MSVVFLSCGEDKYKVPEKDPSLMILGKWSDGNHITPTGNYDPNYYLEFNKDNTYSWGIGDKIINGIYKIKEIEKVTSFVVISRFGDEVIVSEDATLFKILASGSSEFDIMWVYVKNRSFALHLYIGNERVRIVPLMFSL